MVPVPRGVVCLAIVVVVAAVVIFLRLIGVGTARRRFVVEPSWPTTLVHQASLFNKRPTNTTEAAAMQWEKSDELCVPSLGEPWHYKGERSLNSSVTLYFTPESRDKLFAGSLSGIEVDYYGYVEESLVGSYFSEERTSKDGKYHSVSLALRDSRSPWVDLCSEISSWSSSSEKYAAIVSNSMNELIPMKNTDPSLTDNWKEGSCIPNMGYHWVKDTVGGKNFTYKAANTVPVVPMYDNNGDFVAVFFLATSKKQNWASTCSLFAPTPECSSALNFWDPGPGLSEANEGLLYMCSNMCGDCQFTGSGSTPGVYTTMHWYFGDPSATQCIGSDRDPAPYCPSGEYPAKIDG